MNEGKSLFIRLLEFGESNELSGTNFRKVREWALVNGFVKDGHTSQIGLLRETFFECFQCQTNTSEDVWGLKAEYHSRLLEYRELVEARQNAKEAKEQSTSAIKIAIWSIIISAFVGAISITIQLYGTVSLSQHTIEKLTKSATNETAE